MKIVLAYSGGLDTSVIVKWLKETHDATVVAFVGDVGQGDDLDEVAAKARRTGAEAVEVADLREEFVRDFVFPAVKAAAVYEGDYLLGTSLARPVIARHLVKCAAAEGAEAVAHGCTGKGNDQVRFELTVASIDPSLKIVAPWREWSFTGREDLMVYAEEHGIDLPVTREKPYSMDANLMHISYEGGVLEDPWVPPPTGLFQMTVDPEEAPDKPQIVEIDFVAGEPVAVNGLALGPVDLLELLNAFAGAHGVGRVDIVENRYVGMKSRGVYETPGATVLHVAHRAVESITMDREAMHLRDANSSRYAELVYNGYWYSPERKALQALVDETQKNVTGTARIKLYKGAATVLGRRSPKTLYNPEAASFEGFESYNSKDAEGFIRVCAQRLAASRSLVWGD